MIPIPALIILALVVGLGLWASYQQGYDRGELDGYRTAERDWKCTVERLHRQRDTELDAGRDLEDRHARQRLRLRGVLREARRWKAVAVSLGWRRPRATPGVIMAEAAEPVAQGQAVTMGADGRVHPMMVFLPPQPDGTDMEALSETVRRIVESDAWTDEKVT